MNWLVRFTFSFFLFCLLFVDPMMAQTSKIDSLNNLINEQKGEELVSTYLKLAKEYLNISPDKSIEIGEKVHPLAIQYKNRELECQAKLTIGSGMIVNGDFVKGKKYIDEGLQLARKINNIEQICAGINAQAVYYMNTGDYEKAISLFYECADEAKLGKLEQQEAMVRFNIGAILTSKGEWSKGLKEFKYALEYFRKTNNNQYISRTLTNIAVNYSSWGDYKMSLSYYEKALTHLRSTGDRIVEGSVLNNIGEIYKDTGDYEKALSYYQQSLDIALEFKSKMQEAVSLVGKGETYWLLKEYDMAEHYSNEALRIFTEMQMNEGIARSYYILGEVSCAKDKPSAALDLAFRSKALADSSGIKDLQEKVYLLISKVYEKNGNVSQSFHYFREYSAIKDSLFNEKQSQQLAQLRSELELQDKENQIGILQKDNQIKDVEIKRQRNQVLGLIIGMILLAVLSVMVFRLNKTKKKANDLLIVKNNKILEQHKELIKVNETKDMFLSIIGHDLRNPIGAFKDMLDQLADYPEMFPEDTRKEIINELRKEAANTYFLLDNMLFWAKSQRNKLQLKKEHFQVNEVVESNILLNSRFSENKKIKLNFLPENNYTVFADQNMVSLVFRNLISNAIKFTPENGRIDIVIKKRDSEFIEVSVIDNGVGIPGNMIHQLFDKHHPVSTYGTNNEKGSGLGLILCSEFVEKNGGMITVNSTAGKGSTFRFTLKLYKKG